MEDQATHHADCWTVLQVIGSSSRAMLHRSAVFLICFIVIHMLGNLTFLQSDEAFNAYGHKLEALRPATTAIEVCVPSTASS